MQFLKKIFRRDQIDSKVLGECSLCGDEFSEGSEFKIDMGGGHCWGCLSEIEAEGFGVTKEYYLQHHDELWERAAKKAE